MTTIRVQVALTVLLAAVVAACLGSALSIENERPVKVTHRNSGPRYDIGEVERTRALLKEQTSSTPPTVERTAQEGPAAQDEVAPAVGHIALRRIFLFPIMRAQSGEQPPLEHQAAGSNPGREQEEPQEQSPRVPMMMAKPLWPFMMPARPTPGQAGHQDEHDERPHIIRHLFGADQASRSPDMETGAAERDERQQSAHPFDPIQMMMDMMHQAISSQLGRELAKDLNSNKQEAEQGGENSPAAAESSDERPAMPQVLSMKPGSQNETREDIVEIEGRKYVRKTLINRHVGDNLVFMTRRLIFIPLNETTGEPSEQTGSGSTTTELPSSSSSAPQPAASESDERPSPSAVHRVGDDKPNSSEAPETSSSSPTSSTTTTTPSEQPPTSSAKPVDEQTAPSSKLAEPATTGTTETSVTSETTPAAESKAAGRLVETGAESSPKPVESEKVESDKVEAPRSSS